jgi:epsilon-lactone hydrolase
MRRFLDCIVRRESARSSLVVRTAYGFTALFALVSIAHSASTSPNTDLLARENLVPWELRWNQGGSEIGLEARGRMLKARGFQRYAIDYSRDNGAALETEITASRRNGVEVTAVYFWLDTERPGEDPQVRAAFESFKRLGIRPQIWVSQADPFGSLARTPEGLTRQFVETSEELKHQFAAAGFDLPAGYSMRKAIQAAVSPGGEFTELQKQNLFKAFHRLSSDEANLPKTPQEQAQRLEREARRIGSLAQLAARYGFTVGLYNHNGWFGLMDNQLAIIERLKQERIRNVGIVYTTWHARDHLHDDVKDFEQVWARIQPHVLTVAISGVRGEIELLYPSEGEDELPMLRIVQKSGWRGPVAVLCLKPGVDPDTVLRNVLRGIDWLTAELNRPGSGGVRPFPWNTDGGLRHSAASTAPRQSLPPLTVPARVLSVPDTVSLEMQKLIAQPMRVLPANPQDWTRMNAQLEESASQKVADLGKQYGVTVSQQVVGGVPCYVATPNAIAPGNRNRLILALHGGGGVLGGGRAVAIEAIVIAEYSGIKTMAIDYRLAPEHAFPAAMDDAMAVWREALKRVSPSNIGLYGFSIGGGMALAITQRAKREGLSLPAAIVAASSWSDLSKTGDSYFTNAGVDNQIVYEGALEAMAKAYAQGKDLKDPLISPVYGDFTGFPVTFLVAGTRDLLLSDTVRVARKLRRAGVETQLEVYEGQSHGSFYYPGTPEHEEFYRDVARFFDAHLGSSG